VNARTAARRYFSLSGTIRSKHSDLTDPTNRSAKAFKWDSGRQAQGRHVTVPQQVAEGCRVERVSVQNEVFHAAEEAIISVGQVPCDLRHPTATRFTCDPGDLHGAGFELHDAEDDVTDQSGYGQYFDGEKVGRRQPVPMRGEECLPRHLRAAFRCGLNAVVLQDRLDRVPSDVMAEVLQPAADAGVAPRRILLRHANDERGDVRLGGRATQPPRLRTVVLLGDESLYQRTIA